MEMPLRLAQQSAHVALIVHFCMDTRLHPDRPDRPICSDQLDQVGAAAGPMARLSCAQGMLAPFHALFKQRAKQKKMRCDSKPDLLSSEVQFVANQERLRLYLLKQNMMQMQELSCRAERANKRQCLEKKEAVADQVKSCASAAVAEYKYNMPDTSEDGRAREQKGGAAVTTPQTLQRSSRSVGTGRLKQSATAWVDRLLMRSDYVERRWDSEMVRREIRQNHILSANPEDGILGHPKTSPQGLDDAEYRVSEPEYWRGFKSFLEPCGEGTSKKAYRITESAWSGNHLPGDHGGHGGLEQTPMLLKGRSAYEHLAAVVTRAERKVENDKIQKGDCSLDVRLELCNSLRAAVSGIGPPVIMGRSVPMDNAYGYSRLVLVTPFCETLDDALASADDATANALWASTERLMLQIARARILLADFKPGMIA